MKLSRLLFAFLFLSVCVAPPVGASESASDVIELAVDRSSESTTRASRSGDRTPAGAAFVATTTTSTTTTSTTSTTAAPPPPRRTSTTVKVRRTTTTTAVPAAVEAAPSTGGGKEGVVRIARAQVGKSYRSGATGPNAFDCSGLVFYVFNQAGIALPRLTSDGYFAKAKRISRSELQPGDLVVGRGHIGIYVGSGQMVHASTSRGGVKLAPMDVVPPIGYGRL